MKKLFLKSLIITVLTFSVFSQELLDSKNSSWQKVIPGELICEPQQTSYGFALITDSKYLISFSGSGTLLWDKPLKRATNPFFTVLPGDFFAVVTNSGKRLALLNPSGNEIWNTTVENPITKKPFAGRDGRFFVSSDTQISCYGVNGIRKWVLDTPQISDLPFQELSDGSFVIFLQVPYEGRTKGLRISPFGEILEEIIFSGIANSTVSCPQGILISFTNGLSGLFSLSDNKAKNKWVLQNKGSGQNHFNTFVLSENKTDVIFITNDSSGSKINYIDLNEGKIEKSYPIASLGKITSSVYNNQGVFITDSSKAYFYNHQGIEIWSGIFPAKSKASSWSYFTYTPDNFLILFDSSWTANAYRTIQDLTNTQIQVPKYTYSKFYNIEASIFDNAYMPSKLPQEYTSDDFLAALNQGDYGAKEEQWISFLLSGCYARQQDFDNPNDNLGIRREPSIFQRDASGYQSLLRELNLFGTDTFVKLTANLISKEKDKNAIMTILSGLINNGYDPDGEIINAIYHLSRRTSEKDDGIIMQICDAVYSICLFNGRPAFYAKGKEILSLFLYPKYSAKARNHARTVFKKISDLGL